MASDYDMGYSAKDVMVRARAVVSNRLAELAGKFRGRVKYVWAARLPGVAATPEAWLWLWERPGTSIFRTVQLGNGTIERDDNGSTEESFPIDLHNGRYSADCRGHGYSRALPDSA